MDDKFLEIEEQKSKEAKWNMFRFQDHLLNWMSISAMHFQNKDYPAAFMALTTVYTDAQGFFEEKEKEELEGLFEAAKTSNSELISYMGDFQQNRSRERVYSPPTQVYYDLVAFRKKLLELMTKYQLTIPQIKKSVGGAGSQ